ncbi:putative metalloprotease with PDZ domain [Pedobacter sp. CAN_A7]|uniref:M61 family metallopeptidase n=1 Tax=Pedobacter sp. CAN_A7 TaxID=2787722 RepID=UPI0018CA551D
MCIKKILRPVLLCLVLTFVLFDVKASEQLKMVFTIAMDNPASGIYQAELRCEGLKEGQNDFKMPVWMPGYYQIMNYADDVQNMTIKDLKGNTIPWERANHNTWRVYNKQQSTLLITYHVKTSRSFVATNYLNADRGFIAPTGMFLHVADRLNVPVTVNLKLSPGWGKVATGLEKIKGKAFSFYAPDFDVLYDSPMLMGNIEEFPSFSVRGVPHYFIAYKPGDFDKVEFMQSLKKVIEAAVDVIGEIPFKDYTFIGIGPGGGGIEHLNSTAVAFSGSKALNTPEGRKTVLSFLGHEYFHHYNAKRIRPIELGPFDYDNGSRTNMLWVAEGVTTYYDEMLLRRAGLESSEDILKNFQFSIKAYESSPGRFFQSVSQASYDTWSDGPFGRTGDEVNKTISYYQKGPVLAMMLDFKIRHETLNKKTLDDVMRALYFNFYKKLNRGYTEAEFKTVCEQVAGVKLDEFFSYVYTVGTPDYKKYLAYAGLDIDLTPKIVPGAWLGVKAAVKNGALSITEVEWESPAWKEGIRRNSVIVAINGAPASLEKLDSISKSYKAGDIVRLGILTDGKKTDRPVILQTKSETSFEMSRMEETDQLQQQILKSWLGED